MDNVTVETGWPGIRISVGVTETGNMGHVAVETRPELFLCGGYKAAGVEMLTFEIQEGTEVGEIEKVIMREMCRRCVLLLRKRGGPVAAETATWDEVVQEAGGADGVIRLI
jgi:hypothetical protein